jgi:hypothetical protein
MKPEQGIAHGTPVAEALQAFHESVNQPGTIFSRDHWLLPKFERLRRLLNDPVTEDQAAALLDVLYQKRWMSDLIEWLEQAPEVSWADFFEWRKRRSMVRSIEQDEEMGISLPLELEEGAMVVSCPRCSSPKFIPYVYGYPSEEGIAVAKRGELVFGGCFLDIDGPRWYCPACRLRWRYPKADMKSSVDVDAWDIHGFPR